MTSAPASLYDTDSMEQVMHLDDTKAWNLLRCGCGNKYLGFVSKSKISNSYREVLVHFWKTEDFVHLLFYYLCYHSVAVRVMGNYKSQRRCLPYIVNGNCKWANELLLQMVHCKW